MHESYSFGLQQKQLKMRLGIETIMQLENDSPLLAYPGIPCMRCKDILKYPLCNFCEASFDYHQQLNTSGKVSFQHHFIFVLRPTSLPIDTLCRVQLFGNFCTTSSHYRLLLAAFTLNCYTDRSSENKAITSISEFYFMKRTYI